MTLCMTHSSFGWYSFRVFFLFCCYVTVNICFTILFLDAKQALFGGFWSHDHVIVGRVLGRFEQVRLVGKFGWRISALYFYCFEYVKSLFDDSWCWDEDNKNVRNSFDWIIGSLDVHFLFVCFCDIKQSFRNWGTFLYNIFFVVSFDTEEDFVEFMDNFSLLTHRSVEVLSVTGPSWVGVFLYLHHFCATSAFPSLLIILNTLTWTCVERERKLTSIKFQLQRMDSYVRM